MGATPADGDRFVAHSVRTSMFFPASRLFVAGNPKSAGTTLRWWLLRAHGVDVDAVTGESLWGESAPAQVVWDDTLDLRFTWERLSDSDRQDALGSPDVLTVHPVRHPVTRAFSSWAGKYLTGEPGYEDRLPPELPRLPPTIAAPEAIGVEFGRFVAALARHVEHHPDWDGIDVHFWPQQHLLARPAPGPVLVLRQEAMAEGLAAITSHLRAHGIEPGQAARLNETVVGYRPELVDDATADLLRGLYDDDFAAWDYPRQLPTSTAAEPDLPWLNDVRGRNRRYGVLHRAALDGRQRTDVLEAELAVARRREQELLASTSWRVTRPLRWASERARRR